MKLFSLAAFLSAVAAQDPEGVTMTMPPVDMAAKYPSIPNEYIVVFQPGTADAVVQEHLTGLQAHAHTLNTEYHIKTSDVTKEFRGYSIKVDSEQAAALLFARADAAVKYVEQNGVVKASDECSTQLGATWGITRTSEVDRTQAGIYQYGDKENGEGVDAYILDTGIATDNVEFEGRATWGADFASNPSPGTDLNGHGTHVAGTVCGKDYGVAKGATCIGVAVLGPTGSGSFAGIISGMEWAATEAGKKPKGKSVANMSLGGGKSQAVNDAVNAAFAAGLPMFLAAGNEYQDACNVSPASAKDGYTVMSSDSSDRFSSFSNYGSCCDVIAPGSGITAAWIGNPYAINTISGTSMAAPHVCGVAAKLLSAADGMDPADLYAKITSLASSGKISSVPNRAPTDNALLYMGCDQAEEKVESA
jgi:subtilisin family serine protease